MAPARSRSIAAEIILFSAVFCLCVSAGDIGSVVLRPPHGGGTRHTVILPLTLFPRAAHNSSSSSAATWRSRRHLHGSPPPPLPNARMHLHDDLLLNGYYTTRLYIGTPSQKFALIVDTGSSVTYVPCSTCEQCGRHQDPKIQPDASSSYKPVKCNIDCSCDSDKENCIYERQYAEMSSSSGVLGEDIIYFGNESFMLWWDGYWWWCDDSGRHPHLC